MTLLTRFACMTHAVDELTALYAGLGLTRQEATHFVWETDLGGIGSDRGIWVNASEARVATWLSGHRSVDVAA